MFVFSHLRIITHTTKLLNEHFGVRQIPRFQPQRHTLNKDPQKPQVSTRQKKKSAYLNAFEIQTGPSIIPSAKFNCKASGKTTAVLSDARARRKNKEEDKKITANEQSNYETLRSEKKKSCSTCDAVVKGKRTRLDGEIMLRIAMAIRERFCVTLRCLKVYPGTNYLTVC